MNASRPPSFARAGIRLWLLALVFAAAAPGFSSRLPGQDADTLYRRGRYALAKSDPTTAIMEFTRALQLDPASMKDYEYRANAYRMQHKPVPAIADYNQAIQLDPKNAELYNNRGLGYIGSYNYTRAIADFDQAVQLNPKLGIAYSNRGLVHQLQRDFDDALADENEALRIAPNYVHAYVFRGSIQRAAGHNDLAIADFTTALQLDPGNVMAHNGRGAVYFKQGHDDLAVADYTQALQLQPADVGAYNDYAWLLATSPQAASRDGKKALEYATKACQLTNWKSSQTLDTLAAACAETGDFVNAVKWEKQALQAPRLSAEAAAKAQKRLALYQAQQPYREGK